MRGHDPLGEHGDESDRDSADDDEEREVGVGSPGGGDVICDAEEREQRDADEQREYADDGVQRRAARDGAVELSWIAIGHVLGEIAHRSHGNTEREQGQIPGDGVDEVPRAVAVLAERVQHERHQEVGDGDRHQRHDPVAADVFQHDVCSIIMVAMPA